MSFRKYSISEQAILSTILYSDIFSFPLTKDELWRLLICDKKITHREFGEGLQKLKKQIVSRNSYYCLSGRETIISDRIQNIPEVEKKMRLAYSVAKKLSTIPSVLFIGISGGLAVGNATVKDDIDFVIITRRKKLFMTRLLILGVLERLGLRRSWNQKHTANTICVNLLLDETALGWFGNNKDTYTAREIAQLLPLYDRENTYQQFLYTNKWIKDFLPNVAIRTPHSLKGLAGVAVQNGREGESRFAQIVFTNPVFESFAQLIQLSLIKRHQTKEIVTKHVLAFHPNDYRVKTLRQLRLKTRQLGLLTNF